MLRSWVIFCLGNLLDSGVAQLVEHQASNLKVAKPWFDLSMW